MAQDLSVPYIGYPSGPKPPSIPPRLPDRGTSLLRGILGMDPEWQSVMDPSAADNKKASNAGATISDLLNLFPLASALKGPKVARSLSVPRLEANQKGAINLGGDPKLYLNHATDSSAIPHIIHSGKFAGKDGALIGPSLAVSHERGNAFKPDYPNFIFKAGFGDKIMGAGATHVNRDGYFTNPMGSKTDPSTGLKYFDPEFHAELLKYYQNKNIKAYGTPDLRLGQEAWSGKSQAGAIAFSPNFRTMKEFEESPFGAGALRRSKGPHPADNPSYKQYDKWLGDNGLGQEDVLEIYRKLNRGLPLTQLEETAVKLGRALPSEMSELKVPQLVGFKNTDAALYAPDSNFDLYNFESARDAGFPIVSKPDLARLDPSFSGDFTASAEKMLYRLAPPQGGIWVPPRAPVEPNGNSKTFMDFIAATPKHLPTSPSYTPPPKVFDMGAKGGKFDPGLEIPTLGSFKPKPKLMPPLIPTPSAQKAASPELSQWLEAQKPPPLTPPKLTLGSDGTLGPMMQFAPAKKGWTKGTGPEQPGKVPKLQPGDVDLDNLFSPSFTASVDGQFGAPSALSSSVKPAPGAGPSAQMLKEIQEPTWELKIKDYQTASEALVEQLNIPKTTASAIVNDWVKGNAYIEDVIKKHLLSK